MAGKTVMGKINREIISTFSYNTVAYVGISILILNIFLYFLDAQKY